MITNLRMDLFEALVSTAQPLLCTPELSFANISLSLLLGSVIGPPLDLNTISVKVYTSVYNAGTHQWIVCRMCEDDLCVSGEYRVELPDGRVQIVSYHADHENGFIADVRYEGEAHPEPAYHPAPAPYAPAPVAHHAVHHAPVVAHPVAHHAPLVAHPVAHG